MSRLPKITTSRVRERELERLSPFELKEGLMALAGGSAGRQRSMLDAGRGNPNWTAVGPREAFFMLGRFAMEECREGGWAGAGLGGVPRREGIAERLRGFLRKRGEEDGAGLAGEVLAMAGEWVGEDPDGFVFEMTEGVAGCQYPSPPRMLPCCEQIVGAFLRQEVYGGRGGAEIDIFATEGGTAAMCYIFESLVENGLLRPGDRIALGTPAFTPYIEIPQLAKYRFRVTRIEGSGRDERGNQNYQYPDAELDKLADPGIKALFLINPANPTSVMMSPHSRTRLAKIVSESNPNLMILTDDVYGSFVEGFGSLAGVLPRNTLLVYSFSKYFGCTGWRLGTIALARDNVYDDMLAALPGVEKKRLAKMYGTLTLKPAAIRFIDRLVADSRSVALNHTAGLSTPQQVQMALMAAFALLDVIRHGGAYKKACNELIHRRYGLFWEALGIPAVPDPLRADYYCIFDLREWAVGTHGQEFFEWLNRNFEPVDLAFRMAEECSVVLLNGGGFCGPEWSVRVSLANLDDKDYTTIGRILAAILAEYVGSWKESRT